MKTTCQICAREIKSKNGVIAHHGYTRPHLGSGWKTASCMGARNLPYEKSRDLIPVAIEAIEAYKARNEVFINENMANPPETLVFRFSAYSKSEEVKRPEGFDSVKIMNKGAFSPFSERYEVTFHHQIAEAKRNIKGAIYDLNFLKDRFEKWVLITE